MKISTRTRLGLAVLVTLAVTLALPGSAGAAKKPKPEPKRQLTVMTQNLYLGSSLTEAIDAGNATEFLAAVAKIYGTAVASDFPKRAEAVADTIADEDPDLIGLQEVTNWIAFRNDGGTQPLRNYDFLRILLAELQERGLHYSVGAVSQNANIGPAPLVGFAGCPLPTPSRLGCFVQLQDRDVILVNDDTPKLEVLRSDSGSYKAQETLALPDGTSASFARGWALIDGTFEGKKFRHVNTHLEVEGFRAIQEAQAREFLAGPARAPGAVIATGDFNSAADPATTNEPTATYRTLTKSWFDDAWAVNGRHPGLTCCQSGTLTNQTSTLRTRIDLILLHGPVRSLAAHVVGDTRLPAPPPLWASDHAGVVATLRVH